MPEIEFESPIQTTEFGTESDQTSEQQEQSQSSSEQESSNTNTNSTPAAQPDNSMYMQIAANAIENNRRLQARLDAMEESQRVASTPKPPEISDDDIASRPAESIRTIVQRAIAEAVTPLQEDVKISKRQAMMTQNYGNVLNQIPALMPYSEALLPEVKRVLGNAEPTEAALAMAVRMAVGDIAINNPGLFQQQAPRNEDPRPSNQNNNVPQNNNNGRTLPPSTPNRATSAPVTPKVKLTERERRAMLSLGFKEGEEAQFQQYLNAEEVTFG